LEWLTVKKKAESEGNRLLLIFFATFFNQVKKVEVELKYFLSKLYLEY
jgi:hypothetical protein